MVRILMDNYKIVTSLHTITTSRLCSIAKLYQIPQVETSNVLRLIKALQSIKKEDRVHARVVVDVSYDEVLDMLDGLSNGIDAYKKKYNVRTFPKDLNIYQLIEALNKIDAKQLIKDIIIESATSTPKEKSKGKVKKELPKKLTYEERRKLELLSKNS
ncbi:MULTISPECIES: hypothetical protein [Sphingobacterium]|uniref:hypothetical protein n=1 Tax=Sphingobacterium TaxID=28453 RepID=UPI0013DB5876|nr:MULTISPECIES: hypothetical protein [unclassified Sphingobacterium]